MAADRISSEIITLNAAVRNPAPIQAERAAGKAVERTRKSAGMEQTSLQISVHQGTCVYIVRVFNANTGELIREFPPCRVLDGLTELLKYAGTLIDREA